MMETIETFARKNGIKKINYMSKSQEFLDFKVSEYILTKEV